MGTYLTYAAVYLLSICILIQDFKPVLPENEYFTLLHILSYRA